MVSGVQFDPLKRGIALEPSGLGFAGYFSKRGASQPGDAAGAGGQSGVAPRLACSAAAASAVETSNANKNKYEASLIALNPTSIIPMPCSLYVPKKNTASTISADARRHRLAC
ncbi:hypothetical protein MPL3356_60127 [Mesorhizobium plurifarium]|uniref:Uncharacterized protein n=1 Tax=Mesorhizobium plurifarium TaxID=69974 RepID=A0A090E7X1_MESPL|nr:hypothetical protein MPL3356_60127 [Mesorhizobium plurifarium]